MKQAGQPCLGSLELRCRRYAAMVAWYRDLLQADVVHRDDVHAWLRVADGWHLLLVASTSQTRPRESAGVVGPAFEYPGFDALRDAYGTLRERNIYPERAVRNGWATSLIYRDPDGNAVALRFVLPEGQRDKGTINPLGDEFDPQQVFGEQEVVS